ncbi:MAG: phosphoribosylglycinamide synthetase C domain-containing protein, partial [Sulfobacillus sp.]
YRKGDVIEGLAEVQKMETPQPLPEPIPMPLPAAQPEPKGWKKWLAGNKPTEKEFSLSPYAPYHPTIAYPLHAGTALRADGRFVTNGGRVINVVGRGPTLADARRKAYEGAQRIRYSGKHFRTDIGERE